MSKLGIRLLQYCIAYVFREYKGAPDMDAPLILKMEQGRSSLA
jgi:hypothetical protein